MDVTTTTRSEDPGRSQRRAVVLFVLVLAAISLIARWVAVFTEAINWDEFALLARAESTLRLGQVAGGGRPGLVSIILIPFVKGCVDSVQAVVQARLLWQIITLAYLAGVYFLVRRWFVHAGRPGEGRIEGLLAVALLAFLPAFVTWSVQVRTDQVALATATWGGVLLLSPACRNAVAAGVLFGVSILCSQKGLYVIGLCGVLFLTGSVSRIMSLPSGSRPELARLIVRAGLAAAGVATTVGLYAVVVPTAASLASGESLATSLEVMNWVRARIGYRAYTVNASRLLAHWVLFAFLILSSLLAIVRRDRADALLLATSWVTLALGLAVIRFHGSSFPYFLMTAGLFPAVALGMSAGRPLVLAGEHGWKLVAGLMLALITTSAPEAVNMLGGLQGHQRAATQLVRTTELRNLRGFQNEGALFCAGDPRPMPAMFTQDIKRRASLGHDAFRDFIEEFRRRPIAYIVGSYRMSQFPREVREFWRAHYLRHSGAVYVAGFRVQPEAGPDGVAVIASGKYQWIPSQRHSQASLRVDGQVVPPRGVVSLQAGRHQVETIPSAASGVVILAISAAPSSERYPFYDPRQIKQLRGRQ